MENDSYLFQRLFKHWTYRIFVPGEILRKTYEAFKDLLRHDSLSHELMVDLEELYYKQKKEDFTRIADRYELFSNAVSGMVSDLNRMNPGSYLALRDYFRKFDFYIRFLIAPPKLDFGPPFVLSFDEIDSSAELVGNKAQNLFELKKLLPAPVPDGFVITVNSFNYLLEYNNLRTSINDLLTQVNIYSPESLQEVSGLLMSFVRKVKLPGDIENDILSAFDLIEKKSGKILRTAVRSSAVSEDSDQSFAGQYKTMLGITREGILDAYKEVLASKYTPEALFYRISYGLSDDEAPMAVLVLQMIDPEASGVVYTVDPAGQDNGNQLLIHAVSGLGELLVSGIATPDVFQVDKKSRQIVKRQSGNQEQKMVLEDNRKEPVLVAHQKEAPVLTDQQATELIRLSMDIEKHFGAPQDVEWCVTGANFFILQSRPLHRTKPVKTVVRKQVETDCHVLLSSGVMASTGAASGRVYLVDVQHELDHIPENSVLVARDIPPSYVRVMNRLVAVVADSGSTAGHFATVCREFGIPLLVSTGNATELLPHARIVTVDAVSQKVYDGRIDELISETETRAIDSTIPYYRKLKAMLDFIVPLKLLDPKSSDFVPQSCRSMHDIIRFVHEKGVQTMFGIGGRIGSRARSAKKLTTALPLDVFLLDVGGGLAPGAENGKEVTLDQLSCEPLLALWKGLSHPGIKWEDRSHFDWKTFDEVVMAGGVANKDSADFASYAIISPDYLNVNIRFGYHFTIVDTLCGGEKKENYCLLRFAGGGGDFSGRSLRIAFLMAVLEKIGFQVDHKGDLLDARIVQVEADRLAGHLNMLGRLLGATKLMDMALTDDEMVDQYVQDFFNERYHFLGET